MFTRKGGKKGPGTIRREGGEAPRVMGAQHPPPSFPMTIEEQLRLESEASAASDSPTSIVGVEQGELIDAVVTEEAAASGSPDSSAIDPFGAVKPIEKQQRSDGRSSFNGEGAEPTITEDGSGASGAAFSSGMPCLTLTLTLTLPR